MSTKRMRGVTLKPRGLLAMLSAAVLLPGCSSLSPSNAVTDSVDTMGSAVEGHARGVVSGALIGCWVGSGKDLCLPAGAVGALVGGAIGVEQGLQLAKERRASRRGDKG
jgi:hypothetical protein